jgi:hypothetical protein
MRRARSPSHRRGDLLRQRAIAAPDIEDELARPSVEQGERSGAQGRHEAGILGVIGG